MSEESVISRCHLLLLLLWAANTGSYWILLVRPDGPLISISMANWLYVLTTCDIEEDAIPFVGLYPGEI